MRTCAFRSGARVPCARDGRGAPATAIFSGAVENELEDGSGDGSVNEVLTGFGVNAALVEEIRQRFDVDPTSVHPSLAL